MVTNRAAPCRALAGGAVLAALAACSASGVVVSKVDQARQYDPMEIRTAGSGDRQIPVTVIGNPFPEPKAAVDAALVQGMQRTPTGVRVNFSTDPTNVDPQRPYRVVLVFNPARSLGSNEVCKHQDAVASGTPQPDGRVALLGVFCTTDFDLSHALARAPVTSIGTQGFDAMVSQLTFAMFPITNPHRQTDDIDAGPPIIQ